MEKEKYYIPKVEELHVGFEYEIINYSSNNYSSDYSTCKWNTKVIEESDIYSKWKEESFLETIMLYLRKNHIRVKYLDREDIESLGWIHYINYESGPKDYKINIKDSDNYYVLHDSIKELWYHISIVYPNKQHPELKIRTLFEGKIKNKSELKKLMQQLNIQ